MHPTITVVTPTKNASNYISMLISSLESQTSSNFIWLVVDSYSTDDTRELIKKAQLSNVRFFQQDDFSIYHALNISLNLISTPYYLVVGSDDSLTSNSIQLYLNVLAYSDSPDFIFSAVSRDGTVIYPRKNLGWLYGMHGVGSSHSIGTLIKTALHGKLGNYSAMFPMLADSFFVKSALMNGASAVYTDFIAGYYTTNGFSSKNKFHYLLEFYEVQVRTVRIPFLQFWIFIFRFAKHGLILWPLR